MSTSRWPDRLAAVARVDPEDKDGVQKIEDLTKQVCVWHPRVLTTESFWCNMRVHACGMALLNDSSAARLLRLVAQCRCLRASQEGHAMYSDSLARYAGATATNAGIVGSDILDGVLRRRALSASALDRCSKAGGSRPTCSKCSVPPQPAHPCLP
eukprot:1428433-Rhodomonas_salina.1